MGGIGEAVSYTVIGLGFVIMIFVGAFVFVQASRRGNRRFKWWRTRETGGAPAGPSRSRDS